MSWHRSERRLARPFFKISHLSSFLDDCYVMVGDQEHRDLGPISLDPERLSSSDVSIVLNLDVTELKKLYENSEASVELLVTIRDPMLKRREVIHRSNPLKEICRYVTAESEIVQAFSHANELHFIVSLMLAHDCAIVPGFPSRAGEWIAKRNFKLAVPSQITNFRIQEMTPEQSKSWLGSEGALVYVEYREGALTDPVEEGVPVAECFVAKRLLDRVRGRSSALVNGKISSEIIYWILRDAANEIKQLGEVKRDTPLESVMEHLSAKRNVSLTELKQAVDEPRKLRALLEDRFNLIEVIGGNR